MTDEESAEEIPIFEEVKKAVREDVQEGMKIGMSVEKELRERFSKDLNDMRPFDMQVDLSGPLSLIKAKLKVEFKEKTSE